MLRADSQSSVANRVQELLLQWPAPAPLPVNAGEHQRQIVAAWPHILHRAAELSAQANLPMEEALDQAAAVAPSAMMAELRAYHADWEAGLPPAAALRNLADRCNVPLVSDTIELMVAAMDRRLPSAPFLHALAGWVENNTQGSLPSGEAPLKAETDP